MARAKRRARTIARAALVVSASLAIEGARATTWTADGRSCKWPLELAEGVFVNECVPYGRDGALWCVAEDDGKWGVCADLDFEASARGKDAMEAAARAATTLAREDSSDEARRQAMEVLESTSTLMLKALARESIEIEGEIVENPVVEFLAKRQRDANWPDDSNADAVVDDFATFTTAAAVTSATLATATFTTATLATATESTAMRRENGYSMGEPASRRIFRVWYGHLHGARIG